MSEQSEFAPDRDNLIAWVESSSVGYDRSDLVEFGKDLWCVLSNRTLLRSGPATIINRVMESEVGWMRGPLALYEMQRESLGRAADRKARLPMIGKRGWKWAALEDD